MFYATSSKVGVRLQFCEAPHSNSSVSYPETGSHKKKIALIPMSASHDLRPILMRFFFFFRFDLGFSANRGHFTPAKPRSRLCASRVEFTVFSEMYPALKSACPPAYFEVLQTMIRQNLTKNIWSTSSKSQRTPMLERWTA